ncbi:MAG: RHS repeat-associated core domain-containing protein [Deltaproteobacteria bacterium]|nr:RHS repeat-associated core domain-containing protein [Deltaproteobacteria bacterium]
MRKARERPGIFDRRARHLGCSGPGMPLSKRSILPLLLLVSVCGFGGTACSGCQHEDEENKSELRAGTRGAVVGMLTSMGNGARRSSFTYDALGRRTSVDDVVEGKHFVTTTTYGYPVTSRRGMPSRVNGSGLGSHVVSEEHPDGEVVRYERDLAGNPVTVTTQQKNGEPRTIASGIKRNARGDVVEERLGDGTTTRRTYNDGSDLRLRSIKTVDADGAVLQSLVYEFDELGNVRGVANETRPELSARYEYDGLDRLVRAVLSDVTHEYGYDATGNLTNKEGRAQAYSDPAHLHAVSSANGATYTYDPNGNLTGTSAGLEVEYDAENMPTRTARGGARVTRKWLGEAVWKKDDGTETTFYVTANVRYQVPAGKGIDEGAFRKTLPFGAERDTDGVLRFVHSDLLGSSVLVTDAGKSVHDDAFLPFGEARPRAKKGDFVPKRKFHGNEDDPLGFYDYGARIYMPDVGRWMTPDTIEAGNAPLNRYAYASNNPVSRFDPDGHDDKNLVTLRSPDGSVMIVTREEAAEAARIPYKAENFRRIHDVYQRRGTVQVSANESRAQALAREFVKRGSGGGIRVFSKTNVIGNSIKGQVSMGLGGGVKSGAFGAKGRLLNIDVTLERGVVDLDITVAEGEVQVGPWAFGGKISATKPAEFKYGRELGGVSGEYVRGADGEDNAEVGIGGHFVAIGGEVKLDLKGATAAYEERKKEQKKK